MWLVFSFSSTMAGGDRWFAPDKVQHFFSSAFVQSMSYGSLRATGVSHGAALAAASLTTAAVGVGKEVHDRHVTDDFSVRDLAWDAAGALTVSVLLVRTQR